MFIVDIIYLTGEKIFHIPSLIVRIKKGGGVILDLSHEIDYIINIFGKIKILNFIKKN